METFFTDFYLGLDSFAVCIGLGALYRPSRLWWAMALSFGLADGCGTALGLVLGRIDPNLPTTLAYVAPLALGLYGIVVAVAAMRVRSIAANRVGLVVLPLLLSLDNLLAGASGDGSAATLGAVVSTVVTTGIMALLGLVVGAALTRFWPILRRVLPGGAPIAAALIMSFG